MLGTSAIPKVCNLNEILQMKVKVDKLSRVRVRNLAIEQSSITEFLKHGSLLCKIVSICRLFFK